MRFLHTADWHLGRKLFGYDLLAEQQASFAQVVKIAQAEQVDAVVIAGDLYDRQNPSEEAVRLLNQMISDLNLTLKQPLLVINGNHDSAVRLGVGSQWFEQTGYYLRTTLNSVDHPIVIGDSQFFLLPYFELYQARQFFDDETIHTLVQAMTALVARMMAQFDASKKHILVAHFFAAGSTHSDSETSINVGGLDAVPLNLLTDFDYVALGHIHNKDALHEPRVRYSGSLNKFSLSEVNQTKGVLIVDTEPEIKVRFRPITPLHEVQQLTGAFADLSDANYLQKHGIDQVAYTGIVLTDTNVISNASNRLKQQFPRFLTMSRANGVQFSQQRTLATTKQQTPQDLLADFYQTVTGQPLNDQQVAWAAKALKETEQ